MVSFKDLLNVVAWLFTFAFRQMVRLVVYREAKVSLKQEVVYCRFLRQLSFHLKLRMACYLELQYLMNRIETLEWTSQNWVHHPWTFNKPTKLHLSNLQYLLITNHNHMLHLIFNSYIVETFRNLFNLSIFLIITSFLLHTIKPSVFF